MKCEFLTECGMCTMKSKAANSTIYCSHASQFIYKNLWTGEEIKNAIVKIDETKTTQLTNGIGAESEDEE